MAPTLDTSSRLITNEGQRSCRSSHSTPTPPRSTTLPLSTSWGCQTKSHSTLLQATLPGTLHSPPMCHSSTITHKAQPLTTRPRSHEHVTAVYKNQPRSPLGGWDGRSAQQLASAHAEALRDGVNMHVVQVQVPETRIDPTSERGMVGHKTTAFEHELGLSQQSSHSKMHSPEHRAVVPHRKVSNRAPTVHTHSHLMCLCACVCIGCRHQQPRKAHVRATRLQWDESTTLTGKHQLVQGAKLYYHRPNCTLPAPFTATEALGR